MPRVDIQKNSSRIRVSIDDDQAEFLLGSLTTGSGIDIATYVDGSGDQLLKFSLDGNPTPASHAASHHDGASDEISVTGLSGLLDDSQTPLAHKTSHQNGGSDEISVTGLSGVLIDRQDADKLYGRDIDSGAPSDNNLLVWNAAGSAWTAENNILVNGTDLLWAADGGGDIGASADNRPANIYATTDGYFSGGSVRLGAVPAGVSADYGLYTTANTDTLGLWSTRSNASDAVSVQVVADVNVATVHPDHKLLSVGWVNDSDSYTESFTFKEDTLEMGSGTSALLYGDEEDGSSAVAVTVGSELSYTSVGSKLFSVVNTESVERAAVDYRGDLSINKLDNGQGLHFKSLSEETTIAASAYTDTAIQIPAECQVSAVTTRVTTSIPTPCTYDIGVAGATDRYGSSVSGTAGVTTFGLSDGVRYYASGIAVRITPTVSPGSASGSVRVTVHYMTVDVPTG